MVVSLLLGPVVIVIADQLMGYLVDRVDGSNYKAGFTYDEIAHVHTLTNTGLNIKHVLLTRINSN
jgi:hypothetical protein